MFYKEVVQTTYFDDPRGGTMEEIKWTIGADPEVFLLNPDGTPAIAIGKLGGTKLEPRPVPLGAVQEDNVLAEFNIEPANHPDVFVHNIQSVMGELQNLLPEYQLGVVSSMRFDLMSLVDYPEAMEFGCDPDFNAWTGKVNDPPNPMTDVRTAGGHVHIGFDGINEDTAPRFVQMLDFYLGLPSVLLDNDTSRRGLYGKAGAYRPKPYGVEYRTLSNFWIKEEIYMRWLYHNCYRAIVDFQFLDHMIDKYDGEEVQSVINESRRDEAKNMIRDLRIPMPNMG